MCDIEPDDTYAIPIKIDESGKRLTFFGHPFGPNYGGTPEEIKAALENLIKFYSRKLELYVVAPNDGELIAPDVINETDALSYWSDSCEAQVLLFGAVVGRMFHGENRIEEAKQFAQEIRKHLKNYIDANSLF